MAFISMYEARGVKGRRSANYDLMGYSVYNDKKGYKYLVLALTAKCLVRANIAIGDYADLLIELTTGEVVLQRVTEGGWKVFSPTKKNKTGSARFRVPITKDYNLPEINKSVEIKNLHISDGKIIFNFNQLKKFVKVV